MPKLIVHMRSGETVSLVSDKAGQTVMQVIRDSGFHDEFALCGGSCACGTCHVIVEPADATRLHAMGSDENELLGIKQFRAPTSRLSCQIPFTADLDGLRVTIAPKEV